MHNKKTPANVRNHINWSTVCSFKSELVVFISFRDDIIPYYDHILLSLVVILNYIHTHTHTKGGILLSFPKFGSKYSYLFRIFG